MLICNLNIVEKKKRKRNEKEMKEFLKNLFTYFYTLLVFSDIYLLIIDSLEFL